jgi:hypothetical protein
MDPLRVVCQGEGGLGGSGGDPALTIVLHAFFAMAPTSNAGSEQSVAITMTPPTAAVIEMLMMNPITAIGITAIFAHVSLLTNVPAQDSSVFSVILTRLFLNFYSFPSTV